MWTIKEPLLPAGITNYFLMCYQQLYSLDLLWSHVLMRFFICPSGKKNWLRHRCGVRRVSATGRENVRGPNKNDLG